MPESLGTITVKLGDPVTKRLVATWQEAFKEQERKVAGLLAESNARAETAERELATFRERRCETCKHWQRIIRRPPCPNGWCSSGQIFVSVTKPDFGCNAWEARDAS